MAPLFAGLFDHPQTQQGKVVPNPELVAWISLLKNILLALAALVTMALAVYGVRTWKRDLVGKEVYSAAKNLLKESHLIVRSTRELRSPIFEHERKVFTASEIAHTTAGERWRISESEAYRLKVQNFALSIKKFDEAQLELRVLVGSNAYLEFQSLGSLLTRSVILVNNYLSLKINPSQSYLIRPKF